MKGLRGMFALGLVASSAMACGASSSAAPLRAPPTQSACRITTGVSLSLASGEGGSATSIAAAEDFAVRDRAIFPAPATGWRIVSCDGNGTLIRSADTELHAFQGSDGTWKIDAGHRCAG
jgi:hypothetical protein